MSLNLLISSFEALADLGIRSYDDSGASTLASRMQETITCEAKEPAKVVGTALATSNALLDACRATHEQAVHDFPAVLKARNTVDDLSALRADVPSEVQRAVRELRHKVFEFFQLP